VDGGGDAAGAGAAGRCQDGVGVATGAAAGAAQVAAVALPVAGAARGARCWLGMAAIASPAMMRR
jgi:hypothetical protein